MLMDRRPASTIVFLRISIVGGSQECDQSPIQKDQVQIPPLILPGCVTLNELPKVSVLNLLTYENRPSSSNSVCLRQL